MKSVVQYDLVPVETQSNNVASEPWTTAPFSGRVLFCNGVFYAQLPVDGHEKPLTIALHGVSSELEAEQALTALLPGTRREAFPLKEVPAYGN